MAADQVTRVLEAIEAGDPRASGELLPLVYEDLRALAARRLARELPGQTLQATALVHEAYLRLVHGRPSALGWDGRGHFFAAAAEAMRRILIERARARGAIKRGGGLDRLQLDPDLLSLDDPPSELLDLSDAIERLASFRPAMAELVKLRFFAGLTLREAAALLGIAEATADRHWAFARAWLYNDLTRTGPGGSPEGPSASA